MPTVVYGIPNCDMIKKARVWLDARRVPYVFHDYRTQGVTRALLEDWVRRVGWEKLLNRASTTFKELPAKDRETITEKKAYALMLDNPTMIKRPVLDLGEELLVGFKPDLYEKAVRPAR